MDARKHRTACYACYAILVHKDFFRRVAAAWHRKPPDAVTSLERLHDELGMRAEVRGEPRVARLQHGEAPVDGHEGRAQPVLEQREAPRVGAVAELAVLVREQHVAREVGLEPLHVLLLEVARRGVDGGDALAPSVPPSNDGLVDEVAALLCTGRWA